MHTKFLLISEQRIAQIPKENPIYKNDDSGKRKKKRTENEIGTIIEFVYKLSIFFLDYYFSVYNVLYTTAL